MSCIIRNKKFPNPTSPARTMGNICSACFGTDQTRESNTQMVGTSTTNILTAETLATQNQVNQSNLTPGFVSQSLPDSPTHYHGTLHRRVGSASNYGSTDQMVASLAAHASMPAIQAPSLYGLNHQHTQSLNFSYTDALAIADPWPRRRVVTFNLHANKAIQEFLCDNVGQTHEAIRDIVRFLRTARGLHKRQIGEYLGSGSLLSNDVLKSYVQSCQMRGIEFDNALRQFLSGFRLPGEAQKIDRIMEAFAIRFCEENPLVFSHPDTAYVLAFSLIMLNTDLHNPNIKKRMTIQDFIANNRGINDQDNLSESFLEELYQSILKEEIKMDPESLRYGEVVTFCNPDVEGWLGKLSAGTLQKWKKRWFVLTDSCLYYFKSPEDDQPRSIIPLENILINEMKEHGTHFALYNESGQRLKSVKFETDGHTSTGRHIEFQLRAPSSDDKARWIHAIRMSVMKSPIHDLWQKKLQTTRTQSGKKESSGFFDANSTFDSVHSNPFTSPKHPGPETNHHVSATLSPTTTTTTTFQTVDAKDLFDIHMDVESTEPSKMT